MSLEFAREHTVDFKIRFLYIFWTELKILHAVWLQGKVEPLLNAQPGVLTLKVELGYLLKATTDIA